MSEEKTIEVSEEYLESLKLSCMRADICKMVMDIKDPKSIKVCYYFMRYRYDKELIDQPRTIEEMTEDLSDGLLHTLFLLFKSEPEDYTVKRQVLKFFEEEMKIRETLKK